MEAQSFESFVKVYASWFLGFEGRGRFESLYEYESDLNNQSIVQCCAFLRVGLRNLIDSV